MEKDAITRNKAASIKLAKDSLALDAIDKGMAKGMTAFLFHSQRIKGNIYDLVFAVKPPT